MRLIHTLTSLLILTSFVSLQSMAQNDDKSQDINKKKDEMKILSGAPVREHFSSDEDYNQAKENWIKENPDAYVKINAVSQPSLKRESAVSVEEETNEPRKP